MNSKTHPIYVVGDSHVDVFSGYNYIQPEWPEESHNQIPLFKTARLGAVLAYNISNKSHITHRKLIKCLSTFPKGSHVMIVAGEVDCRAHLVKQATLQHKSITDVAKACATKYFNFILDLSKKGFLVIVCAALPTTPYSIYDNQYPTVGNYEERTIATCSFNDTLENLCRAHQIHFITIYHKLFRYGRLNQKYFIDSIHMSTNALPLYFSELKKIDGIDKTLLKSSLTTSFPDIAIQTLKRKTLSFWLQHTTFYPSAQKCVQFIKSFIR